MHIIDSALQALLSATLGPIWKRVRGLTVAVISSAALFLVGCASSPGDIESWPITGSEKSEFSGTVVDVECELSGNCTDDCGNGSRQLAIRTENTGTVLAAKNLNNYSGAVVDLKQYCGQVVDVNGLLTVNQGVRFFQVQNVRSPGGSWHKADRYLKAWVEQSGKSIKLAEDWEEHDDRVDAVLAKDGRLGLGLKADAEYFK